ncbi:MAG TPA: hypothetical protein VMZ51_06335 [Acidimicrobiales bacterium]|nr:hypothetical protein [Acidimicrobiales bacterium]
MRGTGADWRLFVLGSEVLFGRHHPYSPLPGGLHVYANYPEVQIGPLSLLLATPFRLLGRTEGRIAASLLLTAVAPAVVYVLERAAAAVWQEADRRLVGLTVLFGGLVVVQAWSPLATIYARLDDVLLLAVLSLAVWAVALRRPWLVGAALGAGMALKPWGVVALPLVLALPRRDWWRAAGLAGAVTAVAWLPFVFGDHGTLSSLRPQSLTSPASVLGLLGLPFEDSPGWVRPLQFGSALVLGAVAVARGRWGAVLLVGIALRVGLDPEVFLYYSTGLLVAALVWDLVRSPRPLPAWTLAGFLLLDVAYVVAQSDDQKALLRLLVTAGVVLSIAVPPRSAQPAPA